MPRKLPNQSAVITAPIFTHQWSEIQPGVRLCRPCTESPIDTNAPGLKYQFSGTLGASGWERVGDVDATANWTMASLGMASMEDGWEGATATRVSRGR